MSSIVVILGLTLLPCFFIWIAIEILAMSRLIPGIKWVIDFFFYPIWVLKKRHVLGPVWMICQLLAAALVDYQLFCFMGVSFVSHVSAAIMSSIFFIGIRWKIAYMDKRSIVGIHQY